MSEFTAVFNLLISFLFGGVIGWLREKEGKSAGLRTHILVSVGSALFMIISGQMILVSGLADPGRIAAGVVSGIGFIGAGCILRGRNAVKGITTAASIWIVAAIGMACGLGFYVGALAVTIIAAITLEYLGKVEHRIIKSKDSLE